MSYELVSEDFEILSGVDVLDKALDYPAIDYYLTYQNNPIGPYWFNGIPFEQVPSDVDSDRQFENVLAWSQPKVFHPHPVTVGEADPTRGNRVYGFPIALRRKSSNSKVIISAIHHSNGKIRATSYHAGSQQITGDVLYLSQVLSQIPQAELAGLPVAISYVDKEPPNFTGLGNLSHNLYRDAVEYKGTILSVIGSEIVIEMNDPLPPTTQLNLEPFGNFAIDNQNIYLIPFGQVLDGTEQYAGVPTDEGCDAWTYYTGPGRTPAKRVETPRFDVKIDAVNDIFKYFVIIERDKLSDYLSWGIQLNFGIVT